MKKIILNGMMIIAAVIIGALSVSAQTAKCSGSQLALKEAPSEGDMGGKVHGNYVFTNISKAACTLSGFPGFVLLDRAGKAMRGVKVTFDLTANNGDDGNPALITLAPKETAWFQILYQNGFGYDLKKPVAASAKVKITAPHTARAFVIKSKLGAYRSVKVSAVKKGLPE